MIHSILFLPHGMQIIPGLEEDQTPEFRDLDNHMNTLMSKLKKENLPQNIVVITPHGYNLKDQLVIYNHDQFTGTLYKLEEESNVIGEELRKLQFHGNRSQTDKLIELAQQNGLSTLEELVHGYPGYPLQLNWGVTVPLNYYNQLQDTQYSILCYPRTRHSHLQEVIDINHHIKDVLLQLPEDFVLLISGDLSHVHQENGPYGIDQSAKPFDELIQVWAEDHEEEQMAELLKLQPKALACGMAGLNLIHQLINEQRFELQYAFYGVPTYFGMGGFWWKNREI